MKILVVEDCKASIESAKMQLADHELTFATTCSEVIDILDVDKRMRGTLKQFDLILSDMNIPMGKSEEYSVYLELDPNHQIPGGLVIALSAIESKTPCIMVTDSNSHHDLMGLMIDKLFNVIRNSDKKIVFFAHTRPRWIETPIGLGKDWLMSMEIADMKQ